MLNFMASKFVVKPYFYQSVEACTDLNRIGNLVAGVYECSTKDKYVFPVKTYFISVKCMEKPFIRGFRNRVHKHNWFGKSQN